MMLSRTFVVIFFFLVLLALFAYAQRAKTLRKNIK